MQEAVAGLTMSVKNTRSFCRGVYGQYVVKCSQNSNSLNWDVSADWLGLIVNIWLGPIVQFNFWDFRSFKLNNKS